eukprot:TRINITY_DN2547_c2_g2_i3.p1 TRINITY_DN2547_c2_g2~~TRINITY_DN2547_c2_g2_i3.p1  ORF type:complete len:456 (-),score=80.12 TRINITY_DN2547_c2_g2_i3:504-1817(-)
MSSKQNMHEVEAPVNEETCLLNAKTSGAAQQGTATSLQLTLNLVTCGLGTGIFTLPWSAAGASSVTSVLIIGAVLALNAWTISILIDASDRHQVYDVGSLLAKLPGRLGSLAELGCNLAILFTTFFCLVSYVIVMVDCIQPFLGMIGPLDDKSRSSSVQTGMDLRTRLVGLVSLLVFPLCFMDQRKLAFTSFLAVAANVLIFGLLAADYAAEKEAPKTCFAGLSWGSVAMMAAMMQTVVIQVCVPPMYLEMENRSPGKFNRVVQVSFFILFVICAAFAVVGYEAYGEAVNSNVILNLPHSVAGNIGRLSAAVAVAGVYPIILLPMVAPLRTTQPGSEKKAASATAVIVASVMIASFFLHDLGELTVINGAVSMGAFVALVPFLVGIYLLDQRSEDSSFRLAMYALLLLGMVGSVMGVLLVDNYTASLKSACAWWSSA